jgi:hypothetical protein
MRLALFTLAVFLSAPATAQELPAITLVPGEAVTVRLEGGGRAGQLERGAAEWTPLAVYAARHFAGKTPPDAPVPVATEHYESPEMPPSEPPVPGQLRLRFFSIADQHTLLVIENGLQGPIAYRARMTIDGEARATDVCIVPTGVPGVEHWPHPIERIELTDFRYVSWRPGEPVPCQ